MSKISVIIPVYNVEEYLAECLDSVINQTYKNIEIICVNDGSTDNSLKILEEYSKKDNRVQIITQENRGLSEARNSGIKASTGEYIYFIDSDDWIELNALEVLIEKIKKDNADIVECDILEHQDLNKKPKHRNLKLKYKPFVNMKIYAGKVYNWKDIKSKIFDLRAYCWNKLYRTELIKNKIFFEGRFNEDFLFTIEAFLTANKIVYLRKNLHHYRKRENSLSNGGLKQQKVNIDIQYCKNEILKIKRLLEKLNLFEYYEKEYNNFLIERLYINHKINSSVLKHDYSNFIDENNYLKLEQKISNENRNFMKSLFSVSTEITPNIHFKKITVLGYTFTKKLAK